MFIETLILEPEEASTAITAGAENTLVLTFRSDSHVIGKRLTRLQAEDLARLLVESLVVFPPSGASKR